MKRLLASLCVIVVFLIMGSALAHNGITVVVNEKVVEFPDQKPVLNEDGRVLVPVRAISEALGAEVEWDGELKKVLITKDYYEIEMTIGERQVLVTAGNSYQVLTTLLPMDTAATIMNGRTMIPLRFISEILGSGVEWDAVSRTVFVTLPEQK